jgi:CDP-glycerol glycerophosphotransferase (TagB/SpsB family)
LKVLESRYIKTYAALLNSAWLKALADKYAMRLIFFPHYEMQAYVPHMHLPAYIETPSHQAGGSIQEWLAKAAVLITDYSSVAMERAVARKPVLYYQFDSEDFFNAEHIYVPGYFDYVRDGFGPVCKDESALEKEMADILERDGRIQALYLERMTLSLPFRDGRCCERAYRAIESLDGDQECAVSEAIAGSEN